MFECEDKVLEAISNHSKLITTQIDIYNKMYSLGTLPKEVFDKELCELSVLNKQLFIQNARILNEMGYPV